MFTWYSEHHVCDYEQKIDIIKIKYNQSKCTRLALRVTLMIAKYEKNINKTFHHAFCKSFDTSPSFFSVQIKPDNFRQSRIIIVNLIYFQHSFFSSLLRIFQYFSSQIVFFYYRIWNLPPVNTLNRKEKTHDWSKLEIISNDFLSPLLWYCLRKNATMLLTNLTFFT